MSDIVSELKKLSDTLEWKEVPGHVLINRAVNHIKKLEKAQAGESIKDLGRVAEKMGFRLYSTEFDDQHNNVSITFSKSRS